MAKYVMPELFKQAFNCPHCHVFANQKRFEFKIHISGRDYDYDVQRFENYEITKCDHCEKPTLWLNHEIDYPTACIAPEAIDDMPDELKVDFEEARKVLTFSPRASAALLRLVVQKLCNIVGDPAKTIDQNIGQMVKNGLPSQMQQALDTVRVTGNEAVHPGSMNLKDDRHTAVLLFEIVNRIVERMIVEPAKFDSLYASLPAAKLDGIANRDKERAK